jgi:hypothetical protein
MTRRKRSSWDTVSIDRKPKIDRTTLKTLDERSLREEILVPLFSAMGYRDVFVNHGTNERGKDIVMWRLDDVRGRVNVAVVVKAKPIRGGVERNGGAASVVAQVTQCFGSTYLHPAAPGEQTVHECLIVCSHQPSPNALTALDSLLAPTQFHRSVAYIFENRLWELVDQYLRSRADTTNPRKLNGTFNEFDSVSLEEGSLPAANNRVTSPDMFRGAVRREIDARIGSKYIRSLYVDRQLRRQLLLRLTDWKLQPAQVAELNGDIERLSTLSRKLKYDARQLELDETPREEQARVKLVEQIRVVRSTHAIPSTRPLLYPELEICERLHELKAAASAIERSKHKLEGQGIIQEWTRASNALSNKIDSLVKDLRPIDVVVDRAGGGKTTLLCRLAEELSEITPTLFTTARAIPIASADGIVSYLQSTYSPGRDPLEVANEIAERGGTVAIVIIDAFNENPEPLQFNYAFQELVGRYKGKRIRFLVSCRDLYWSYFKDEWWGEHTRAVYSGRLYAFRRNEFNKALRLYFDNYHIEAAAGKSATTFLRHPLLLRFFCEAFEGTPEKISKLGRIRDIRLLDLFNIYCEKKFARIGRARGAPDNDTAWEIVDMLGRLMLGAKARGLPFDIVANTARERLGDEDIRRIGSRYIGILDEDIIIEERPFGATLDIVVSFVYEEFMEYVIARTLWRDLERGCPKVRSGDLATLSKNLLQQESSFIPVIGIVLYLGSFLARSKPGEAIAFADWLIRHNREVLACRLLERWPNNRSDRRLLTRLMRLHTSHPSAEVRRSAWVAMCNLSSDNWTAFSGYVKSLAITRLPSAAIFRALARAQGGPTAADRLKTMRWLNRIARLRTRELNRYGLNGLTLVAKETFLAGKGLWKPSERSEARAIIDALARRLQEIEQSG